MVITARGLTKIFGPTGAATRALAGVDLDVAEGSVAIMGPSGSGKTTLLHCLAGIETPTTGTVHLRDVDLGRLSDRRRTALRRQEFGFVLQSGQLLPELPADENVALPLLLDGLDLSTARERARQWLVALGLGGMESRRPGELSGGQAQRVAIARALVTGPGVVFADEPTGALDQHTGRQMMDLLIHSVTSTGAGLVVVTHDPAVAACCDRTVEMRDGRIVADHLPAGVRA